MKKSEITPQPKSSLLARFLPSFFDKDVLTLKQKAVELAQQQHKDAIEQAQCRKLVPFNAKNRYSVWSNPIKWMMYRMTINAKHKRMFVIMHLSTGSIDFFYVNIEKERFVWGLSVKSEGLYHINRNACEYSHSVNAYVGEYVEGCSLPLEKGRSEEMLGKLRQQMKEQMPEIEYSIDPILSLKFLDTTMIDKLMDAGKLMQLLEKLVQYAMYQFIGFGILIIMLIIVIVTVMTHK